MDNSNCNTPLCSIISRYLPLPAYRQCYEDGILRRMKRLIANISTHAPDNETVHTYTTSVENLSKRHCQFLDLYGSVIFFLLSQPHAHVRTCAWDSRAVRYIYVIMAILWKGAATVRPTGANKWMNAHHTYNRYSGAKRLNVRKIEIVSFFVPGRNKTL